MSYLLPNQKTSNYFFNFFTINNRLSINKNTMTERKLQFKPSRNQQKANKRARVKVLKWGAVALWSYDIVNDTCAICRNKLHDLCIGMSVYVSTN